MSDKERYNILLNKAMAYCAGKESCLTDTGHKLASWGADDHEIEKILNHLVKEKFIDEERYATAFVKDKFRQNKWGKVKIAVVLRMKKIGDETISKAMDSIDEAEYLDLLKSIVEKQRKTVKAKNQYELKGKLLRHCLSKGFESHLLYDILNEPEE